MSKVRQPLEQTPRSAARPTVGHHLAVGTALIGILSLPMLVPVMAQPATRQPHQETRVREVVLQVNGEAYAAPASYFALGHNGALFYWPSRTPGFAGGAWPEKGRPFIDVAVEVFLRAERVKASRKTGLEALQELDAAGRVVSRQRVSETLEVWQTQEGSSRFTWYVALTVKDASGSPYVASCRHYPAATGGRCSGPFMWGQGVPGNFRFHLQHGPEWPAIAAEIDRVMKLARKV